MFQAYRSLHSSSSSFSDEDYCFQIAAVSDFCLCFFKQHSLRLCWSQCLHGNSSLLLMEPTRRNSDTIFREKSWRPDGTKTVEFPVLNSEMFQRREVWFWCIWWQGRCACLISFELKAFCFKGCVQPVKNQQDRAESALVRFCLLPFTNHTSWGQADQRNRNLYWHRNHINQNDYGTSTISTITTSMTGRSMLAEGERSSVACGWGTLTLKSIDIH